MKAVYNQSLPESARYWGAGHSRGLLVSMQPIRKLWQADERKIPSNVSNGCAMTKNRHALIYIKVI